MTTTQTTIELVSGPEQAATLLHPLRLRLLRELRTPDSASGLARRLELPRQKVNYHLRELEKEKFVESVEERRKGNCVERILRATARYYLIDPTATGALSTGSESIRDRFSSGYLVAVAAKAIRQVATLRKRAAAAKKRLATMTMETEIRFASAEDRRSFFGELTKEVARLAVKYDDPSSKGGRRFQLFLGSYPSIKEPQAKGMNDEPEASKNKER